MADINLLGLVELDQLGQVLVTLLGGRPNTSSGCAGDPMGLNMLGASELPLRQDFACGKMLVTAHKHRPALRGPRGRLLQG